MQKPKRPFRCANNVMAMVMAEGQGSRLHPLADKRSKPAVPFGSRYRIVDFVLSSLVNSGIFTIYLLVQYKSQSLIEHIGKAWTISPLFPDEFVTVVPPQMLEGRGWFQDTADAEGRIREFQEKPQYATPMPGDPTRAYASMGNYLFSAGALVRALREAHRHGEIDFGQHVLPHMLANHRVFAYDFTCNEIPGLKAHEESAYWRDVGTIDAYFEAHRDVLGAEPRLDLFNPQWLIYSSNYQGPVARVIGGKIDNCLLGAATEIHSACLRNSIIRREAVVEDDAEIEDCIIMDYVRISKGARLRRTIVDRHNLIERDARIGFDPDEDRRSYIVSPSGVVVARGRLPSTPAIRAVTGSATRNKTWVRCLLDRMASVLRLARCPAVTAADALVRMSR